MIIKSMARKEPTFAQLYDYITREGDYDANYCFTRNLFLRDRDSILDEFHRNSALLAKRKNGNYLYHEIISITRAEGISEKAQKEKLLQIVQQYAESRAKNCLVFGGLHDEKDNNLHFHLMISANELNESTRYRLSKKQFSEVKVGLEIHVLEHIPELEQEKLISAKQGSKANSRTSNKEQEMKRRTRKPSQRELLREKLRSVFAQSTSEDDLRTRLDEVGIEQYVRGKTIGFLDKSNDRKYRLKTMGLVDEYEAAISGGSKKKSGQEKVINKKEAKAEVEPTREMRDNVQSKVSKSGEDKMEKADKRERLAQEREKLMKAQRAQADKSGSSDQTKRGR